MTPAIDLVVRGTSAWFGPGPRAQDALVACAGGVVVYAGLASGAPDGLEGVEEVRVEGFLLPALADRHVHVARLDPAVLVADGFTAVRDVGWPEDEIFTLADASEGPGFRGPLIRAAGPILAGPGDAATPVGAPEGLYRVIATPAQASATVRDLAGRGAAHIAVRLGPRPMDDAALAAVVQEASVVDLPVTVDAAAPGQVERALGAGATELSHAPSAERLGEAMVATVARSMRIVSVLAAGGPEDDSERLRVALDNVRRFAAAGGRVALGTDLGGAATAADTLIRELLLLEEAGLDAPQILQAAMRAPLTPGAPADILGLEEDPFESPHALLRPVLVVRGGRVVGIRGDGEPIGPRP